MQIALGTNENQTDLLKLNFAYGTTNNNGNVQSQTITAPGLTATQTYNYDYLNRIKSASETGAGSWQQTFTYDRYGNRRFNTVGGNTTTLGSCNPNVCNPTISPANNRIDASGYLFDNAGNMTNDAELRAFTYDAENKQTKVMQQGATIGEYFYDGDGKRVRKVSGNVETLFIYNAFGQLAAEYSTQVPQSPRVSYLTTDHLGSTRIVTDQNGTAIARHDYMPFGEEIARSGYGADEVRQKFTTYERDTESSLDFAQARYYSYLYGRFTSPDEPFMDQSEDNPQSWNLYIYSGNSPLNFTDPFGLWKSVACSSTGKKDAVCYEAEEGDTYATLADQLWKDFRFICFDCTGNIGGATESDLRQFFGGQSIEEGQVFDLAGWDHWLANELWYSRGGQNLAPLGGGGVRGGNPSGGKGLLKKIKEGGSWVKDKLFGKKSTSVMPKSGGALSQVLTNDRNNLTWIGRALQKHSNRPGSAYKTTANNPSQYNQAGETLAREILENPAAVKLPNRFGGTDIRLPDGRGIRFKADGSPYSLLEP